MTNKPVPSPQSGWRIFRWPLAVAIVSVIGLLSALIGDDWFDVVSWVALGSTVALMIAAWRKQDRPRL
jgi:hypothetical protein